MKKSDHGIEIVTPRLILRTYSPEDADALLAIWQDPELSQFFPPNFKERSSSETKEYVAHLENMWRTRRFSQWGVRTKDDDRLIGYCGLQPLDKTSEVELYYGFKREFWGQGFATEAARAALLYVFEEIKLPRVTALTFPENFASQKVLQKIGFELGGNRNFYGVEVCYFDISRREYEQAKNANGYHSDFLAQQPVAATTS